MRRASDSIQRELGRLRWVPGVLAKIRCGDRFAEAVAQLADLGDGQMAMVRRERLQMFAGELEQTRCRREAIAVLGVVRPLPLLLEVHKRAGELDQSFVKSALRIRPVLEPKILEDIMSLVILAGIEAGKVAEITGVERRLVLHRERGDKPGDTLTFLHKADRVEKSNSNSGFPPVI